MERNFGKVHWTTHAMERMAQRGIRQGDAWATLMRPQQSRRASTGGAFIFYRTYGREKIEVVAKKNERKEWVVLSVWSRMIRDYPHKGPKPKGWWWRFWGFFTRFRCICV